MVPRNTMPASSAPRPPMRTASTSVPSSGAREADGPVIARSLARERGVERPARRLEVHRSHELARFRGAVLAIHPNVFPLHRQRTVVVRGVELTDHFLEVDPAAAERPEL